MIAKKLEEKAYSNVNELNNFKIYDFYIIKTF